jgi:hypothetical protein
MATAHLEDDTEALALRLRRHVVQMCNRGGGPHIGSCLSVAGIGNALAPC